MPIMPGMDPVAIEEKLKGYLNANAEREGIAAAWLFGSVARWILRPGGDVNLGILYSEDPSPGFERFGFELDGERKDLQGLLVQVVVLNRAPVDLIIQVLRHNKLLVERDRSKRVHFEVRSRNEYWDLEPYLTAIRAKL